MRFPWRKQKDYVNLEEARAERERSERNLQEAEPLLHALREIRRRNHIGEMITSIIEREVEKKQS